jgi:hypothetical protein
MIVVQAFSLPVMMQAESLHHNLYFIISSSVGVTASAQI